MKTILTILLSLNIFIPNVFSQPYSPEWTARFNAGKSSFDLPTNMVVDSAGNVYITGKSWGDGSDYDYSTIKYNTAGVLQWEARYNGTGNYTDIPNSIAVDKYGNVFVTGKSFGVTSDYDYATIKYNSNGVQQWVDRYNGSGNLSDEAFSITVDDIGNFYVSGISAEGSNKCTTIKYSPLGLIMWKRSLFISADHRGGKSIKINNNGDVIVGDGHLGITIKYNSNGDEQWIYYTLYHFGDLISLSIDNSNNILLLENNGLIKLNNNGDYIKGCAFNGTCNSMKTDKIGNVFVAGVINSGIQFSNISLVKYDSSLNIQWNSIYNGGGNLYDYSSALDIDSSSNVYVTGYSVLYPFNSDYVTIKYNSSGIKQWVAKYANPYGFEDVPVDLKIDRTGNAYVTGYSYGLGTDFDYLTIKYPSSLQLNSTILIEGFYNENVNRLNTKDTLTAYLRNTAFPYTIADSGKAVIDSLNFLCGFCFNRAIAGTYYVSIKHRNSIETWSKTGGEVFSKSSPTYYNFTNSVAQAYGNNMKQKGSKYCMISGNVNQDFIIDAGDISAVENDVSAGTSGYVNTDLNGDDFVDGDDLSIVENNVGVGVITP